jgi:hypothetical protein
MNGKPYAVYDHESILMYIGLHWDEEDCWRIFLGWPSDEEIKDAKERGLRVYPVKVLLQKH